MSQYPNEPSAETEEIFGFKRVIPNDEGAKNLLRRLQNRGRVAFHGDSSASPQNDISEKISCCCTKFLQFGPVPGLKLVWLSLVGMLIVGWLGVGCAASEPGSGSLEVRIKDHREAIGDFAELWLTFSTGGVHPSGQPRSEGWIEFEPSLQQLDLTQYVEGREAVIAQTMVETGNYNAVRLQGDQVSATLSNGQPVEVKANFEPVALNFRVRGGRTTVLTLDLVVLDLTDHPGQGYELQIREVKVAEGG